jgi:integrase/recombinase XerD
LRIERLFYADRQEAAPLLKERKAFLEHLLQQGTSLAAARGVSWQLLNVIRLLQLTELRDVWIDEIKEAAQRWERQQRRNSFAHSYKHSASFFIYVAKKWLRFAGVLKQRAIPRMRFSDQIADFVRWAAEERGLSALTVRSHRHKIALFLKWFSERRRSLTAVRLEDVDDFLISKGATGWSRKSACGYANSLRSFFRYAEQRGWYKQGIAGGIISPTLYQHEGLPEGPQWKDVQLLLKGVKGKSVVALRARAVLLLLTVYGLRSGEISRLLLSDFDWWQETFTVNHSKRGGVQKYPLQREVGEGIHHEGASGDFQQKSVSHAETSLPRCRVQQPMAHHKSKNRRGRHPVPATRTALSAPRVRHSFAGTRSISEGHRGSAGSS